MGPDPQTQMTDALSAVPADREPVRAATTASMQSLLAGYFESQASTQDAHKVHAFGTRSERPPERPSESVVVPMTAPSKPAPSATVEALYKDWPPSARRVIGALISEVETLRHQLRMQEQTLQNAQAQADRDVLTPTLNRRAFLREVHRAMADCKRYGEDACLVYLDMDGFKAINDAYGHAAGDSALIYVAETLRASIREGDSVGRMGGDEFAILLRHADLASSRVKAMKLEAELSMGTFEYAGLYLKTGGSFGVRAYAGQTTAEAWLSEADAAMFLVKKSSR